MDYPSNFPPGASIYSYMGSPPGVLPPHSAIQTNGAGNHAGLACLSGSLQPAVGSWLSPSGTDLTDNTTDPFDVTQGDAGNPGSLQVLFNRGLTQDDLGLYTCDIPDVDGQLTSVYVGIYHPDFLCECHTCYSTKADIEQHVSFGEQIEEALYCSIRAMM